MIYRIKIFTTFLKPTIAIVFLLFTLKSFALDKNGNFESVEEQDEYIAATLKEMAGKINSQTPIQLDQETQMMSVIALQKTINFNLMLSNFKASQLDAKAVEQMALENLNHTVCRSNATRVLIDLGVKYIYHYFGNEEKLVTQVIIDRYRC